MRYIKPETENAIGCLSTVFWPLSVIMAIFGLIFREKHQNPYANPQLAKARKRKHVEKPFAINSDVDPWDSPPEKVPWEK